MSDWQIEILVPDFFKVKLLRFSHFSFFFSKEEERRGEPLRQRERVETSRLLVLFTQITTQLYSLLFSSFEKSHMFRQYSSRNPFHLLKHIIDVRSVNVLFHLLSRQRSARTNRMDKLDDNRK